MENKNYETIKTIITKALENLYLVDSLIIDRFTKEECINHRFAIALGKILLETEYDNLDVDVEYNRNYTKDNISFFGKNYPPKMIKSLKGNKHIIPDLIVHKRGSNKNNFLCIEAKKVYNSRTEINDFEKIIGLLNPPYNYNYGCLVEYQPEEEYFSFIIVRKNLVEYEPERINVNKPNFNKTKKL